MYYAPHILQKEVVTDAYIGDDGNPVKGVKSWVDVGKCRCDDNNQQERISANGVWHDYNYHVVHEGERILIGTSVRILKRDGSVRGEGMVIKTGKCNYFSYSQIWL